MAFKLNRSSKEPMSEINVTPFVDVMLVLLIIFMVTAPLLTVGVQVDLPESSADSLPEETEPLTLTINSKALFRTILFLDFNIFFNKSLFEPPEALVYKAPRPAPITAAITGNAGILISYTIYTYSLTVFILSIKTYRYHFVNESASKLILTNMCYIFCY